jgi:hypothetical protein
VGGLGRDPKRLGHLGPGPTLGDGPSDRGTFEAVGESTKRDDGCERGSRVLGGWDVSESGDAINLS